MRKNKGITLIALVITIIVMLVLVTVTITLAVNGKLFDYAQRAAQETETAKNKERELANINSNMSTDELIDKFTSSAMPDNWYTDVIARAYSDGSKIVPIPKGFTVSSVSTEKKVADGLVIYEGTEPVTDENHTSAMENRNQYVWIPVDDINDMIMCKSRTDESECDLDIVNGVLKCKNHSSTATDLCGRIYEVTDFHGTLAISGTPNTRTYTSILSRSKQGQTWKTAGNHEPDIVLDYDEDTELARNQMKNDFYSMAESVATYGGFYVARYELQANAESKKNKEIFENDTWYNNYNAVRREKTIEGSTVLVGQMIWLCQHNHIIHFIDNGADDAEVGHIYQGKELINSGMNSDDKLKNIYDLEGNKCEYTACVYSTTERCYYGGNCFYRKDVSVNMCYPASSQGSLSPYSLMNYSTTRQTLYVPVREITEDLNGSQNIAHNGYTVCCFDPEEQVLMADGTTKNIEDVHIGDMVISLNEDTGEYITQKIINHVIKHNSDDLVYVYLSNGTRIGMRAYHPLLTDEGWKSLRPEEAEITMQEGEEIGLLEVGDTIIGIDGNTTIVSIEQREEIENYSTHLIETEGYHNHVLNGVVVHSAPRKDIYFIN